MVAVDDFSTLFELLPIGAYRMAADGSMIRANAALVRLNDAVDEAELLTYSSDDWYVQPGRRATFLAQLHAQGSVQGFVSEVIGERSRRRRWIVEHAHEVRNSEGQVLYYEGTAEDITARVALEESLQLAVRRYEALTAKSQSASIVCDPQGVISYASVTVYALLGRDAAALIGTNLFDTMHPEDLAEHRREFGLVAQHKNSGEESVARHQHADGSWRYLASFASDARDDAAVRGMIVYWRDVTETHLARERLRLLADTDALTGIANRACFEREAKALLAEANANASRVALYFIDLDNFKTANDSYGHWVGDQVLITVAQRLRSLCSKNQLVARLGGDEFAVLAELSDDAEPQALAEIIVTTLSASMRLDSTRFEVTASVGVAVYPTDAQHFIDLFRYADLAMLAAKSESRNNFVLFTADHYIRARAQAALVLELKQAILRQEFIVYYQPQVDMYNGELIGVEALVRWQHPTRGVIEPDEFIRTLEDQQLINRMGLMVLDQAVRQIADWRKKSGRALRLAINVSARQLNDRSLVARIHALLENYGLPTNAIEVEVTETNLLEASATGLNQLIELRALGVRVVLDDLGVGYSSMSYLRMFPVDGVKLDRSFVSGLPRNAVDVAIVRSIISLAKELNLSLVAEGVETETQRAHLLTEACEIGQGYLFSRPVSPALFEAQGWLNASTQWAKGVWTPDNALLLPKA